MYALRIPEDNYLGVAATTEMLLQSQAGVIRLFPCWSRKKKAAFVVCRRGGFIVSAGWDPTSGLRAEIRSLTGEPCRIRWVGTRLPRVTCEGRHLPVRREGREIVFQTRRDSVCEVRFWR